MAIDNWKQASLGEQIDLLTGFPFKSAEYSEDVTGIPLVRGDNVVQGMFRWDDVKRWSREKVKTLSDYFLNQGDVVLAMDRPWIEAGLKYACVSEHDIPCLLVQRVSRLRAKTTLDQKFLRYVIGSPEFTNYILGTQTGTAVPHISSNQIKGYKFLLPPLPEQHAIAGILSALDDKIEVNRRMNAMLENISRTIFKKIFIKDEQANEWEYACIGDKLTTILGGTPSRDNSEYWNNGTIPWINSGKVNEFRVIDATENITKLGLYNSSTKIVPARTTVIAITGATLGQVSLLEIEACTNQSVVSILGSDELPNEFIYFWIKHKIEDLISWQTGGAQQHINKNNVNDFKILCPDSKTMKEFILQVRPMFDLIKNNCLESRTLGSLRDSLLPKLMRGEVRVRA